MGCGTRENTNHEKKGYRSGMWNRGSFSAPTMYPASVMNTATDAIV
jgi:hypothetical protein